MFQQVYEPVAGSLVLSTLVAIVPIAVLFVLLAVLLVAAQWASLASLATAFVIALVVYGMPVGLALDSTVLGAAFGLFPIVWIVINARSCSETKLKAPDAALLGMCESLLPYILRQNWRIVPHSTVDEPSCCTVGSQ